MKIARIETYVVDAGWRPWIFVVVEADNGLKGYGECSDGRNPWGVVGTIEDFKPLLLGQDPRAYELRFWDLIRGSRASPGGIAAKAIAGIECALIDLKARALGISVVELFGGPTRDWTRVYWSHCGTSRVRYGELLGTPPLRRLEDFAALGYEVREQGFTALKTNILFPGEPASTYFPGFGQGPGTTDQAITPELLRHIEAQMRAFRQGAGPDVDLCLDLNFNFKPEACKRIARALEPLDLLWLEIDMYDPEAILQIKESTSTRICTGENLFYMRDFIPYFELHAADVFMIDIAWNGFAQSKKVGDLAEVYQLNISPHNYYSHLCSFMSASLCAVLPNVRIMEIDIDDVPWKDALVTVQPQLEKGQMKTPTGPGWGTELVEAEAKKHLWQDKKSSW
jgi:L-alanine-DL-glutamate epimerase-like enolase superfamily enzyme